MFDTEDRNLIHVARRAELNAWAEWQTAIVAFRRNLITEDSLDATEQAWIDAVDTLNELINEQITIIGTMPPSAENDL